MTRLGDILLRDGTRQRFVRDVVGLIERQVGERTGLVGLTVRGGYGLAKQVRGDLVRDALDDMLGAFVDVLDPLYAAQSDPARFGDYVREQRSLVAARMLAVTDARRDASRNAALGRVYDMLAPLAATSVERSIPELGGVIQKYLDEFFRPAPTLGRQAA